MQPYTVNFYKAFVPELKSRLSEHIRKMNYTGIQRIDVLDVFIEPTLRQGDWIATLTVVVDIFRHPIYEGELAEVDRVDVRYLLHCFHAIYNAQPTIYAEISPNLRFQLQWHIQRGVVAWMDSLTPSIRRRCMQSARQYHEEIVAKVWAPARVAKLLETGGWDVVEAI